MEGGYTGYKFDIFLSYAHLDNLTVSKDEDGWIKQFYEHLELSLAKRIGRADRIKFWWDNEKLDGTKLFDQTIQEGIMESAIMICLTSRSYMASDYCQQELDMFHEKIGKEKTGRQIGDQSRIVNVMINNIDFNEWPEEFEGRTGFQFHDGEDFGEPLEVGTPEFKKELRALSNALFKMLTGCTSPSTDHSPAPTTKEEGEENKFTIYIGETADTLRTTKKRTITELEKKGFKVLNGVPPPNEHLAHDNTVKEALQKADLSVHMLDLFPSKEIIDQPELYYTQQQTDLSLEHAKSKLIWVPDHIDLEEIEEEGYKKFMQEVEQGERSNTDYEYIRGSKSSLTQQIIDFAEQLKSQQPVATAQKQTSVLLDTHFNDQLYAFELSKALIESQVQPFVNPQEDDPRKNINVLAERMKQVSKLVFFYGSVSKDWVVERMCAALQLIVSNNLPVEEFFIFLAPPEKDPDEIQLKQRFLKVNVLNNSNSTEISPENIHQFLTGIKD